MSREDARVSHQAGVCVCDTDTVAQSFLPLYFSYLEVSCGSSGCSHGKNTAACSLLRSTWKTLKFFRLQHSNNGLKSHGNKEQGKKKKQRVNPLCVELISLWREVGVRPSAPDLAASALIVVILCGLEAC